MPKSVKVHDDTHATLKELKAARRSSSIDEVIREMIRSSTGAQVRKRGNEAEGRITSYASG